MDDRISKEPAPRDRSLTRAERRRLQRGQAEDAMPGTIGCRFCRSTRGEYTKADNRFNCYTAGCRGNKHHV